MIYRMLSSKVANFASVFTTKRKVLSATPRPTSLCATWLKRLPKIMYRRTSASLDKFCLANSRQIKTALQGASRTFSLIIKLTPSRLSKKQTTHHSGAIIFKSLFTNPKRCVKSKTSIPTCLSETSIRPLRSKISMPCFHNLEKLPQLKSQRTKTASRGIFTALLISEITTQLLTLKAK